jgi:hypothetical protein
MARSSFIGWIGVANTGPAAATPVSVRTAAQIVDMIFLTVDFLSFSEPPDGKMMRAR